MRPPFMDAVAVAAAAIVIFTAGVLVGANHWPSLPPPQKTKVTAADAHEDLPPNTYRIPFTLGDGTQCVPHGEWIVCALPETPQKEEVQ
jgi:hypothetical protein